MADSPETIAAAEELAHRLRDFIRSAKLEPKTGAPLAGGAQRASLYGTCEATAVAGVEEAGEPFITARPGVVPSQYAESSAISHPA
jgi:hypothetical protein